jgi:hypothetical protein
MRLSTLRGWSLRLPVRDEDLISPFGLFDHGFLLVA